MTIALTCGRASKDHSSLREVRLMQSSNIHGALCVFGSRSTPGHEKCTSLSYPHGPLHEAFFFETSGKPSMRILYTMLGTCRSLFVLALTIRRRCNDDVIIPQLVFSIHHIATIFFALYRTFLRHCLQSLGDVKCCGILQNSTAILINLHCFLEASPVTSLMLALNCPASVMPSYLVQVLWPSISRCELGETYRIVVRY